jgi:hypothetical protein
MANWPAQHSTTRARIGPGTIGTSTKGHDGIRARAVPALRATLEAQHEHEANFSCRAGTRHGRWHDGPSVPCQPKARHQFCITFNRIFHKHFNYHIFMINN